MKRIILSFTFLVVITFNLKAQSDTIPQTPEQQKEALNLAVKWTKLLTEGKHLDSLMNISTIPFAQDRKKILNSNDELKSFYFKVIERKGKRVLPEFTSEVHSSKYEIIEECIPINVLVIKLKLIEGDLEGEVIYVSVQISGSDLKVIGFSD